MSGYPIPMMYFPDTQPIEFIGSAATVVASGDCVVTMPAGIEAGDFIIAWCAKSSTNAAGFTFPADFTRAASNVPAGATFGYSVGAAIQSLAACFRVATGAEAPTYTWNWGGFQLQVTVAVFRGPVTVEAWQGLAVVHGLSAITSPAYTALADGFGIYCFCTGAFPIATPPSGLTLLASHILTKYSYIYWRVPEATGVVPQETLSWTGSGTTPSVFYQHLLP